MAGQSSGRGPFNPDFFMTKAVPTGAGNGVALPNLKGHSIMIKCVADAGQSVFLGIVKQAAANTLVAAMGDGNTNLRLRGGEYVIYENKNANEFCCLADAGGAFLQLSIGHF